MVNNYHKEYYQCHGISWGAAIYCSHPAQSWVTPVNRWLLVASTLVQLMEATNYSVGDRIMISRSTYQKISSSSAIPHATVALGPWLQTAPAVLHLPHTTPSWTQVPCTRRTYWLTIWFQSRSPAPAPRNSALCASRSNAERPTSRQRIIKLFEVVWRLIEPNQTRQDMGEWKLDGGVLIIEQMRGECGHLNTEWCEL